MQLVATPNAAEATRQGGIAIGHDAVHAWLIDLDAPGAAAAVPLDAAERARAASFLRPRDGARFAASRAALRAVLARYLGGEPEDLDFRVGPHGQPRLAANEVQFSLARSGGLALVAVSSEPVGADLERVEARPGLADVAGARFPRREGERIAAGCCGLPVLSFYRHWTAKEAFLKATGCGLAGLRDTELVCGGRLAIWFAGRPADGWSLSVARPTSGYAAAIVARASLLSWRWLSSGRPVPPGRQARSCR
jgi:4'-phosphopantetheinyl transferase